jgi:hypothetical protein
MGLYHSMVVRAQEPLLKPIGVNLCPEDPKPKHGHTDAVTAICITDSGAVMTAGLDRRLCVFHVERVEAMRRVEHAHEHGIVSVAHNCRANWFVTGGYDGAMKVRATSPYTHSAPQRVGGNKRVSRYCAKFITLACSPG